MMVTRPRFVHALLASALATSVLVPTAPSSGAAVVQHSRGTADASVTNIRAIETTPTGPVAANAHAAHTTAAFDTSGLGGGDVVADGSAVGASADLTPVGNVELVKADTHFPSSENDCAAGTPACDESTNDLDTASPFGQINVTAISSSSIADATQSTNTVSAGVVDGSLDTPVSVIVEQINLTVADSSSSVVDTGGNVVSSTATVNVVDLTVLDNSGAPTIAIGGLDLDAVATASDPPTASATCQVGGIVVLGTNITGPISCDSLQALLDALSPLLDCQAPIAVLPAVPGISVEVGLVSETTTARTAEASVVGLRVTGRVYDPASDSCIDSGEVADIGTASAFVERFEVDERSRTVCGDHPVAEPAPSTARASAENVGVTDPDDPAGTGLFDAAVGRTGAAVDDQGLSLAPDGVGEVDGPDGARADAQNVVVNALNAPASGAPTYTDPSALVELTDAHAAAPTAENESQQILTATVPALPGLEGATADVLEASASAATSPDDPDNLEDGAAVASTLIENLEASTAAPGPAPATLTVGSGFSDSFAENPASASDAGANSLLADLVLDSDTGLLPDVEATLIAADAAADADGTTASTSVSATIADLTVNGIDVTTLLPGALTDDPDGDGVPGPAIITLPGDAATVFIGLVTESTTGGTEASAVIDPVIVQVPGDAAATAPDPGAVLVRLGHVEAHANAAPPTGQFSVVITKDVDEHFDAMTFGDTGATIVHHQKIWYEFCVGNDGLEPLTGVQVTDLLPAGLDLVREDPALAHLANYTVNGQQVRSLPFDLDPGEERRLRLLVEVRPEGSPGTEPGTPVSNTAQATANQLDDPVPSNAIDLTVNPDPTQPALMVTVDGFVVNPGPGNTRLLTVDFRLRNGASASAAAMPNIAQIWIHGPPTVQSLSATPIPLAGPIAPGDSQVFQAEFQLPADPVSFVVTTREEAEGPQGQLYAFD